MSTELELLRDVGKLLNAGLGFEATARALTERMRGGLGARTAALWVREPGGTRFRPIASPTRSPAEALDAGLADGPVESLARLPAAGPQTIRVPLAQDGEQVGILEARFAGPPPDGALLGVLADLLTPWLVATELSADLAHEVAIQSREIDEQRRFISLIIDSLPVGLYVVDREYRIQIWNRNRETGTQGLRRDVVVGRPVFDVLTRQPADVLRAEFDRVFETGEATQEELEVSRDGATHWYRISKTPMRLGGDAITHVITIGEDVTDARLTQARILQHEKLAAIGQLAAGVMHEINNPLATIGACVAAIEGRLDEFAGAAAPAVRDYLGMIDREVDRCTRIVNGLLDFSRPKGRAKRKVVLNAVVDETLFLLTHHARFGQLEVARELDPALPPARANAEQLAQVLMALMLNAVDAMDAGGRLTLRTGCGASAAEVYVEVMDTGPGIARADQSKIFEPFYTTKPPGKGTGLGLSICYGIVAEHGGRIELESLPGAGSTFRVVLPAAGA
ncbi:MAG TPA: ATP-binding protein [Gemmatimonadales bacterium]|nr:ATP-binding protein [Gemmatimonadales bacterium]